MPLAIALLMAALSVPATAAIEATVSVESRVFARSNLPGQSNNDTTVALSLRYESIWNDGRDELIVIPHVRVNDRDSEQNRIDFESFSWNHRSGDWSLRSGIRTVTWQVAESSHLVDVINQIDASRDIDGEDKLGELMFNAVRLTNWGSAEILVMPGFRERVLPGKGGRLRTPIPYDNQHADYESSAGNLRTDIALRLSWIPGEWEVSLSHFSGTGRAPRYRVVDGRLRPYYPVIDQTGLTAQYASGNWLWKAEAISNSGQTDSRYAAAVAGFEFTWSGVGISGYDLGFLAEYLWDERDAAALSNEVFGGVRVGLNDIDGTEFLIGAISDLHNEEYLGIIEGSRRFGPNVRAALEARVFGRPGGAVVGDFGFLHRDDYLDVKVEWYF